MITGTSGDKDSELRCVTDEADGRLLLHAARASKEGNKAIIISSEDTDDFVICLAFHREIGVPIFMQCTITQKTWRRIKDRKWKWRWGVLAAKPSKGFVHLQVATWFLHLQGSV